MIYTNASVSMVTLQAGTRKYFLRMIFVCVCVCVCVCVYVCVLQPLSLTAPSYNKHKAKKTAVRAVFIPVSDCKMKLKP